MIICPIEVLPFLQRRKIRKFNNNHGRTVGGGDGVRTSRHTSARPVRASDWRRSLTKYLSNLGPQRSRSSSPRDRKAGDGERRPTPAQLKTSNKTTEKRTGPRRRRAHVRPRTPAQALPCPPVRTSVITRWTTRATARSCRLFRDDVLQRTTPRQILNSHMETPRRFSPNVYSESRDLSTSVCASSLPARTALSYSPPCTRHALPPHCYPLVRQRLARCAHHCARHPPVTTSPCEVALSATTAHLHSQTSASSPSARPPTTRTRPRARGGESPFSLRGASRRRRVHACQWGGLQVRGGKRPGRYDACHIPLHSASARRHRRRRRCARVAVPEAAQTNRPRASSALLLTLLLTGRGRRRGRYPLRAPTCPPCWRAASAPTWSC